MGSKKEALWLKALADRKEWPQKLEEKSGVRLYKTQSWFIGPDQHGHGNTPVYHVWAGNEWLATEHYLDAYNAWKIRVEEARLNELRGEASGSIY